MCFEIVYNMLDIWFDTINIIGDICWKTLSLFWSPHVFLNHFSILDYLSLSAKMFENLSFSLALWLPRSHWLKLWKNLSENLYLKTEKFKHNSNLASSIKVNFSRIMVRTFYEIHKKTVRLKDQNRHVVKTLLMACTNFIVKICINEIDMRVSSFFQK